MTDPRCRRCAAPALWYVESREGVRRYYCAGLCGRGELDIADELQRLRLASLDERTLSQQTRVATEGRRVGAAMPRVWPRGGDSALT